MTMKTKFYILLLLITMPLFVACSGDDDGDGEESGIATRFTPSQESTKYFANGIDFGANSSEQAVTFTTNKRWTASSTESWCTITPSKGSADDGAMTIKVSENKSYENREAVVTLKTGELNNYITVRQGGAGTAKLYVYPAGTLEQQLGNDYENIKELILTGELNGTDFKFLHEKMYNIEGLDLSEARIVSGGDSYYFYGNEELYTETDKVTYYLLCGFTKAKNIKLPASITSIGTGALSGCQELTSIDIPQGVTSIGDFAFSGCYNLSSVNIPETVTKIGRWAFSSCIHLAKIKLPESVTKLSYGLFQLCSDLKDITYSSKLDSIESDVFSGCTSLEKIIIPKSVKVVSSSSWLGCTNLKTLEYHSEKIWFSQNTGCPNVSNIIIGDEVQEIEVWAFRGYEALRTLTIPANVKKLKSQIFYGCNMETLYMEATTPPETDRCLCTDDMDYSTHTNAMSKCTLYVPRGAKAAYEAVGCPWTDFKEIVEY